MTNEYKQNVIHYVIMYKVLLQDNQYNEYQYVETKTFRKVENISKTPLELKLFSNDVFDYDEYSGKCIIIHSNLTSNTIIPGILDLTMTHGKEKNKFLYLCKPDDKRIPFFLIPYSINATFDKSLKKIYITFQFKHWNEKRPRGIMTQNIGNINHLSCFYEYALYCKTLNISIQSFTKEAKKKIQDKSNEDIIQRVVNQYNIEERSKKNYFIFTLDPIESNDFDDALSYQPNEHKISIYISNVALIIDCLELWDSFSKRISTIYLPDRKRPMLPSMLVDCLCSLKEKENKLCYVLDIFYDEKNAIIKQNLGVCKAYISKNYDYNNACFSKNNPYFKKICEILQINNPKQIVTRLMLHFNHYVARELSNHKKGVFKTLYQEKDETISQKIPIEVHNHICVIKTNASTYCSYHENMKYTSIIHKEIDVYTQATSPIRRLVDLLNNIVIMEMISIIPISQIGNDFYHKWTRPDEIEYINIASRAIRKIQSKCRIYQQYQKNKEQGRDMFYRGYVFDKILKEGDKKYQYMVYIQELNLTTYITLLQDLEEYSSHMFALYIFMNEENDKKKIKLQLCYDS